VAAFVFNEDPNALVDLEFVGEFEVAAAAGGFGVAHGRAPVRGDDSVCLKAA